jgi:hypothetical protein
MFVCSVVTGDVRKREMDSPIKSRSENRVNPYALLCDFCGYARTRRNAHSAEVNGVDRFICAACCEIAGASSYEDHYGRPDFSIRDLVFTREGGA